MSDAALISQVTERKVPCGNCHACCKAMTPLYPEKGDIELNQDGSVKSCRFDWTRLSTGRYYLKRKPNGDCIHLTDEGCSVHDYAPAICREFDCRLLMREKK